MTMPAALYHNVELRLNANFPEGIVIVFWVGYTASSSVIRINPLKPSVMR